MGKVLILRTCDNNLKSHEGTFQWPESGHVECDDWIENDKCGHGLHGLLWGEGNGSLLDWSDTAKWLVVEVEESQVVEVTEGGGGKVKYPEGNVVHCGDRRSATEYILNNGGIGKSIVGALITAGDWGTATAGDGGTATAGYGGTATAGDRGTATAGDRGTATAGDRGTATAGYKGTATAGDEGTATAGDGGTIQIKYWDNETGRCRIVTGYIGENGLKGGKKYRLNDDHEFVEIESAVSSD